ncbi:FAD-binding oxidoreductase [bacterium]|nr:MAG: FAD-binding oxidoreductase [bacterium]
MTAPSTPQELADLVRGTDRIDVPLFESGLFASLRGEIRHDVADGVVSCLAGTTLAELNAALARDARCVPYVPVWPETDLSLAALILLGLPHAGEAGHGSWRDWILGSAMVTAEGTIVRSGSRVVKSVAGYDAHKLLVGSRGALLLPAEVTLRTFHISSAGFPQGVQSLGDNLRSIGRVRRGDLASLLGVLGEDALRGYEGMGTVWSSRSVQDWPVFPYAWVMDPFCPALPVESREAMRKAKAVLDPGGKLAPGAFHNL